VGADDCVQHTCVRFDPGKKSKGGCSMITIWRPLANTSEKV